MKKNFVKICAVLLGFTLVACLDDDKYALDPSGSENIIEFSDESVPISPSGAVYPVWQTTTELATDFTFNQTITYAGPNSNNKAIELTVEVDQGVLDHYNEQMTRDLHGTTYEMMPANYYDMPPVTLTIPKGKNSVELAIKIKPDQFDLTRSFALPLRITSTTEGVLSEHFSAGLFQVVVKNLYDGIYRITGGQMIRLVSGVPDLALGGFYPVNTIDIAFSTMDAERTAFSPKWTDGSGVGGIGGTRVRVLAGPYTAPAGFTAPATAQPIAVTSSGASDSNATLANDPLRNNYYDPATKTFVMNFGWNPGANSRTWQDVTLKWNRSR
jgi:hypothetical protein